PLQRQPLAIRCTSVWCKRRSGVGADRMTHRALRFLWTCRRTWCRRTSVLLLYVGDDEPSLVTPSDMEKERQAAKAIKATYLEMNKKSLSLRSKGKPAPKMEDSRVDFSLGDSKQGEASPQEARTKTDSLQRRRRSME
ncbi:unnamed protein product, partial [Amoebophrya sp. A25]